MTSLRALPQEVLEELYLTLPKSIPRDDIVNALVEDEGKRLELEKVDGHTIRAHLDEYKQRLLGFSTISLAEIAYETCVINDTFDPATNQVWLDRAGKYKVNPNDIYRHLFADGVYALHEKIRGFAGTAAERRDIRRQIEHICSEGRGTVNLGMGEVAITFSADKRMAKVSKQSKDIDDVIGHVDRVKGAFSQFVEHCLPNTRRERDFTPTMGF